MTRTTRRRFLTIAASAVAATLVPGTRGVAAPVSTWRGIALGAAASIRIDGIENEAARPIIAACRAEIERLEDLFSLYRADSAIATLNRTGRLDAPTPDFLALLTLARTVHDATDGAFDPTVQPLWAALAERHAGSRGDSDALIAAAREAVGFDGISIAPGRISFAKPGMAITLNGIAQGFVTDRVAALLRNHGLRNVLVDCGEIVAIGSRRDGSAWPVSIRAGDRIAGRALGLRDRALATSDTLGTTLDHAGAVGHIIDPYRLAPAHARRIVSVEADSAALADGLSTALSLVPESSSHAVLRAFPDTRIVLKA